MSLGSKKAAEAESKRIIEINMKIKRAEKNMNHFFGDCKKILEKQDEEPILPQLPMTQAQQAKYAEKEKYCIRFLCTCIQAVIKSPNNP